MNIRSETKQIQWSEARGTFRALAAAFGNVDRTNDIIERGAFTKTLRDARERKAATGGRFLMPILYMHEATQVCGGVVSAVETPEGLLIEGAIDLDSSLGRDVYSGLKFGTIDEMSIGYTATKATRDKQGVRHLLEVSLQEVSLIVSTYAANPAARVEMVSVKANTLGDVLGKMVNIMTKDMKDWRERRPQLAGSYAPPHAAAEDDDLPPSQTEFATDKQYREAVDDWLARRAHKQVTETQAERNHAQFLAEVKSSRDRRVRSGMASLAEVDEYVAETGLLPSGQRYIDESARVERAYRALFERLDAEEGD